MTINNNVSNVRVGAANNKAARPRPLTANNAGPAPNRRRPASFKAGAGEDDQAKLDAFIAANKAEYPELEKAKLTLGDHLKADAVLFVLAGAVGAGAHEVVQALQQEERDDRRRGPDDSPSRKLAARDYKPSLGTMMKLAADPDLSVRYALAARMQEQPHHSTRPSWKSWPNDPNPMIRGLVPAPTSCRRRPPSKRLANPNTESSPQVRAAALKQEPATRTRQFLSSLDGEKGGIFATMHRIITGAETRPTTSMKIGSPAHQPGIGLTRQMMEGIAKSEDRRRPRSPGPPPGPGGRPGQADVRAPLLDLLPEDQEDAALPGRPVYDESGYKTWPRRSPAGVLPAEGRVVPAVTRLAPSRWLLIVVVTAIGLSVWPGTWAAATCADYPNQAADQQGWRYPRC